MVADFYLNNLQNDPVRNIPFDLTTNDDDEKIERYGK